MIGQSGQRSADFPVRSNVAPAKISVTPDFARVMQLRRTRKSALRFVLLCLMAGLYTPSSFSAQTLTWQTNLNGVSADIKSGDLRKVLSQIASTTGWRVYLEPNSDHVVSTKFQNLPQNEALRLLLGDLNFAVLADTNARSKLLVFRTRMENATQLVRPAPAAGKAIPNELIVRLKPGARIEDIERLYGAKVVGKIDSANAYRLRFDDAAAANSAREQISAQQDVASVEDNYVLDPPETPKSVSADVPPLRLTLNPPPDNGRVVIGLVDTAIQPLGNGLDAFLLDKLSVAGESRLDPNSPSHGTSMAESALRTLQMLGNGSSSVQLLPVDVYGPNPTSSTFDVAAGIAAAVSKGAKIINLSLGSPSDSPILSDLILQASEKNILVFAAKGNEPVTTPFYPAADKGAIPVTALSNDGQVAPYANQAPIPSVGAPGTMLVPYNGQLFAVEGTSVSTAIISATAGKIMDKDHKTAAEALSVIQNRLSVKTTAGQ